MPDASESSTTRAPRSNDDRLAPFIDGDRLVRVPAKQARRQAVLAHIVATSFDGSQLYTELQVNEILQRWCQGGEVDHVTIRRYVIDASLLYRSGGLYSTDAAALPSPDAGQRRLDAMGLS